MKKKRIRKIKHFFTYLLYTVSVLTACYGFWGCTFPDLTLVEGACKVVDEALAEEDAELLYRDILDNRIQVTYDSRLLTWLKSLTNPQEKQTGNDDEYQNTKGTGAGSGIPVRR